MQSRFVNLQKPALKYLHGIFAVSSWLTFSPFCSGGSKSSPFGSMFWESRAFVCSLASTLSSSGKFVVSWEDAKLSSEEEEETDSFSILGSSAISASWFVLFSAEEWLVSWVSGRPWFSGWV